MSMTRGQKIQYRASRVVEANTGELEVMGSNINDPRRESRFQRLRGSWSRLQGIPKEAKVDDYGN